MGKVPKAVPPVCAVVGNDLYLRNDALARILHGVREEMDDLGPTRCDGTTATAADVLDEVRTLSLLGGRRVVIVDDADDFISDNRAALEKYCATPADSGCLILLCDSLPRNTKLHQALAKRDGVYACEAPKGAAFGAWLTQRAEQEYGKRIAPQAAQVLRRLLGDSPGWIDAELSKLASYVGDRKEITAADVEELTDHRKEEIVFKVMDAVMDGDASTALAQWDQVMTTDRAASGRAIGGLAYSLRGYLASKREFDSTGRLGPSARRVFVDPGTLERRLGSHSLNEMLEMQRDLLAADLAVKTSLSGFEIAVERFIVKHTTSKRVQRTRAG